MKRLHHLLSTVAAGLLSTGFFAAERQAQAQTNCIDLQCPTNRIAYACGSNCVPVFFLVTATNLCGTNAPVVFTDWLSGDCFPVGDTTVTATAIIAGETNHCTFTVTVVTNCGPQTPTIINGLTITPIGNAFFTPISSGLMIVNATTNLPFGAAMEYTGFHFGKITLEPDSSAPVGAKVSMKVFGDLNGNTNQLISTVSCVNAGASNMDYSADFSPIGGVASTVLVYDGSNLVATASGLTGVLARVTGAVSAESWTPFVAAGGQPWAVLDFPSRPTITPTGGQPVSGTRLAVSPEANKLSFPDTPIIVTPRPTIGWPKWLPWYKVPFPWPQPPWPDPGDPPPYSVAIGALSRIEIIPENTAQVCTFDVRAGMWGFTHDLLGDASWRADGDRLMLENPLNGTNNLSGGASWGPQPLPWHPPTAINLKVRWQLPLPDALAGSFLKVNINGTLSGLSNQILGFVQATRTASNTVALQADYSQLGSGTNTVEVSSGGDIVSVTFAVSSNLVVTGPAVEFPVYFHGPVPICDPRWCDPPPNDVTFGFVSNVVFHLPGGTAVIGDRIRFYGDPSPQPSFKFESFSLNAGGGLTNLTILSEEELPVGKIFNGLGHLPIGSSTFTTVTNELVVSNAGNPVFDFGASIALGDADGGDVTLVGPDDTSPDGSEVRVRAFGRLGGVPDELLATLIAKRFGTNIQFTPGLMPTGMLVLNISVFDGPRLVGVAVGVTNPTVTIPSKLRQVFQAGWGQIPPGFLRTYIHLPERTAIQIPTPPPLQPILGTDIVIDKCLTCATPLPQPPLKDVLAVSRFDLVGSALSSFRIIEERLGKFGQMHSAIGQAQLRGVAGDLRVNNLISSPFADGIELRMTGPVEGPGNPLYGPAPLPDKVVFWRPINEYGTVLPGATLRASVRGAFVNQSEQLLASSQITDLGFLKEISTDFSAFNPASLSLLLLSNNAVVFSNGISGSMGVVAHVNDWPVGTGLTGMSCTNCPPWIRWRFWPRAQFFFNNILYSGDEIRITPVSVASTPDRLSSLSLQGSGIPELVLSGEAAQLPGPTMLQIQRFGNAVAITWPYGSGQVLLCTVEATGPWWEVPGAKFPPYLTPIGPTKEFYRLCQQVQAGAFTGGTNYSQP